MSWDEYIKLSKLDRSTEIEEDNSRGEVCFNSEDRKDFNSDENKDLEI